MSATVPQYPWSEGDHLFASALNAAFKNGAAIGGPFLLLAGGTVVGPTIFTETIASGSSVPTLLATQWDVTNTGGAVSTYQFQTTNQTNIHSAAGQTIWANNDAISYSSPTPSATGATYVARRMLAYSSTDRGQPGQHMWRAGCWHTPPLTVAFPALALPVCGQRSATLLTRPGINPASPANCLR